MEYSRLLYITTHTLTVYKQDKKIGDVVELLHCRNNDEGQDAFTTLIAKQPDLPNIALVDLVEEEYRTAHVPWTLHGRKALYETTALRTFRQAAWRYWEVQGREKQGRKDVRLLIGAITNPAPIQPWLKILAQHCSPLHAIRSVPHLSKCLQKTLKMHEPMSLLITQQRHTGLRQTLFQDGKLVISRLTPLNPDISAEDYARSVHEELLKTTRYLQRLHLVMTDTPMNVHLVGSESCLDAVETLIPQESATKWHLHPIATLPKKLLGHATGDENPVDHVLARLALTRQGNEYATAADRRYATHRQIRQALTAATLLLPVFALAYSALFIIDARQHQQQQADAQRATIYAADRQTTLLGQENAGEIDADWLRDTVMLANHHASQTALPAQQLRILGQIFSAWPSLEIQLLRWGPGSATSTATHNHDQAGPVNGMHLHLEGQIRLADTGLRQAMHILDEIQRTARAQLPDLQEITLLQAPVDLSPQGRIDRGTGDTHMAGRFVLHLYLSTHTDGEDQP